MTIASCRLPTPSFPGMSTGFYSFCSLCRGCCSYAHLSQCSNPDCKAGKFVCNDCASQCKGLCSSCACVACKRRLSECECPTCSRCQARIQRHVFHCEGSDCKGPLCYLCFDTRHGAGRCSGCWKPPRPSRPKNGWLVRQYRTRRSHKTGCKGLKKQ